MSDNKDNIVDTEEIVENTTEDTVTKKTSFHYLMNEEGQPLLDEHNQPIPVQLKHMNGYLDTLRFLGEAEGAGLTKELLVSIWHKERSIPDTKGILKFVFTDSILLETYFVDNTAAAKVIIPITDILGIVIQ